MVDTTAVSRNRWKLGSYTSALVLAVVLIAGCSSPATTSSDGSVGVNVNGVGEVQGAPDTLTARIGVQVSAEDVTAAIEEANAAATSVTDAVVAAGVDRADIQTQQVSIDPQYSGALPGGDSTISGYQATNTLQVTVRDLSKASAVLGDATSAGGNATRISGVSFRIDDDSELIADARSRAFADARDRAEQYAGLAGGELGDVVSITESITGQEQPTSFRDSAGAASMAVPIEPGQQTVSVSVSVRWALN